MPRVQGDSVFEGWGGVGYGGRVRVGGGGDGGRTGGNLMGDNTKTGAALLSSSIHLALQVFVCPTRCSF